MIFSAATATADQIKSNQLNPANRDNAAQLFWFHVQNGLFATWRLASMISVRDGRSNEKPFSIFSKTILVMRMKVHSRPCI